MKKITAQLGNMRKAEDFVVYPKSKTADDNIFIIQSNHRIAQFDATTASGGSVAALRANTPCGAARCWRISRGGRGAVAVIGNSATLSQRKWRATAAGITRKSWDGFVRRVIEHGRSCAMNITVTNDWGTLIYKGDGRRLDTDKLPATVAVTWPDGVRADNVKLAAVDHVDHVNDMGHKYTVTSKKLYLVVNYHGAQVYIAIEKAQDVSGPFKWLDRN